MNLLRLNFYRTQGAEEVKVGIVSDIHGNYHALEVVADELLKAEVKEVWCLGDIVGYGAFPNECLQWTLENCTKIVLGNHELALLGFVDPLLFSDSAGKAIVWTKEVIKPELANYLVEKGLQVLTNRFQLVHDSPVAPGSMRYILTQEDAFTALLKQRKPVCFFGHTHIPVAYRLDGANPTRLLVEELKIKGGRFLINPGSVGQPRDGNPRASFVILEGDKVTFHRVRYNTRAAAKAIIKAGLPEDLAVRLLFGS